MFNTRYLKHHGNFDDTTTPRAKELVVDGHYDGLFFQNWLNPHWIWACMIRRSGFCNLGRRDGKLSPLQFGRGRVWKIATPLGFIYYCSYWALVDICVVFFFSGGTWLLSQFTLVMPTMVDWSSALSRTLLQHTSHSRIDKERDGTQVCVLLIITIRLAGLVYRSVASAAYR